MRGLPKTQRSAVRRICWTLGCCGGAGFLSTLAITHRPGTAVAIAVCAAAAGLPGIIGALSAKDVAMERERRRTAVVNAGLKDKRNAVPLLKLLVLELLVLEAQVLSDDLLRELLGPRVPSGEEPRLAPRTGRLAGPAVPPPDSQEPSRYPL